MTDAFAELVLPIFQNVIDLQHRLSWTEKNKTLDEVKRQARGWIEAARQRAVVDPALAASFELAEFGLVGWIDEVLTDSEWGHSVDWGSEDHVLEWDLYRSRLRAEKFYEMAEYAETQRAYDPLESYLLCVTLGFHGQPPRTRNPRADDEERLRDWIERVYGLVCEASPVAAKPFPDDAEARGGLWALGGPRLLLKVSILTALTAVLTLIGYLTSVHLAYAYDR